MIVVDRSDPEELLGADALLACRGALGALRSRLEAEGGRLLWATAGPPCWPEIDGAEASAELRAFFAWPASVALGLRAFEDTLEGVSEAEGGCRLRWSAVEIQKGLRQFLRQTHGALEMLGGVDLTPADPEGEALKVLLRGCVTRQAPRAYEQVACGLFERAREGDEAARWPALRHLLTAMRLASEGVLCVHSAALVDWAVASREGLGFEGAEGFEAQFEGLRARLGGLMLASRLPELPEGFEALSGFLVRLRQGGA